MPAAGRGFVGKDPPEGGLVGERSVGEMDLELPVDGRGK